MYEATGGLAEAGPAATTRTRPRTHRERTIESVLLQRRKPANRMGTDHHPAQQPAPLLLPHSEGDRNPPQEQNPPLGNTAFPFLPALRAGLHFFRRGD